MSRRCRKCDDGGDGRDLVSRSALTALFLPAFFARCFGAFDFAGIELTPPEQTFSGELALRVGETELRLIEVGPAHTRGDTLVHVPGARVLFTGDILFSGAHPIAWAGPVSNWIAACDRILAMELETIVPGHGPPAGFRTTTWPAGASGRPATRGSGCSRSGGVIVPMAAVSVMLHVITISTPNRSTNSRSSVAPMLTRSGWSRSPGAARPRYAGRSAG